MYYYGDESEIDLDAHGEREFSDWRWMPLEQLPEEVTRPLCPCFFPVSGTAPVLTPDINIEHRACRAVPRIIKLVPHTLHECSCGYLILGVLPLQGNVHEVGGSTLMLGCNCRRWWSSRGRCTGGWRRSLGPSYSGGAGRSR